MAKVEFDGDIYEAERIVKTSDSIMGYNEDIEVFAFRGISDFNAFVLVEGEYSTELSEKERIEVLEEALNMILLGGF